MPEPASKPTKIDQQLAGPQITVGGRTVEPLARLTGQHSENNGPSGGGAGAWVRLTPLEVIVSDPDGAERRIAVVNPTARILGDGRPGGLQQGDHVVLAPGNNIEQTHNYGNLCQD